MCLAFRYNPTFKVSRRSQATSLLRTRARHFGWVTRASPAAARSHVIFRRQPMPLRVHPTSRIPSWGIPSTTITLAVLMALRAPQPGLFSGGGPGACLNYVHYTSSYRRPGWHGSRFGHPSMTFFSPKEINNYFSFINKTKSSQKSGLPLCPAPIQGHFAPSSPIHASWPAAGSWAGWGRPHAALGCFASHGNPPSRPPHLVRLPPTSPVVSESLRKPLNYHPTAMRGGR